MTSLLYTQTQVLLLNSGTSDSGEEHASAATSVSSPTSQAWLPKHYYKTAQTSELLAKMVSKTYLLLVCF